MVYTRWIDRVEDALKIQLDGGLKKFQPNPTQLKRWIDRVVLNKGKIEIRNIQINEISLKNN